MKLKGMLGIISIATLVINLSFQPAVFAQEFSVEGNGSGSSNSISYQNDSTNTINQSNQSDIDNNIDAQAETGENQANDNSGEVAIETGDAQVETNVVNSGNTSTAVIDCCPDEEESSATIIDNGSDSDNSINLEVSSGNKVTTTNNLNLQNNISVAANTGDNEAEDNGGDVFIETGQVNLLAAILNQNLNNAYVSASSKDPSFKLKISGNGTGSVNNIDEEYSDGSEYIVVNNLDLVNNLTNFSNTGGNKANKNKGKVFISTGNIYLDIILQNKDINISKIVSNCCQKSPLPSPTPTPSGSPSPSPSSSPSPSPSGSPTPTPTPSPTPGGGCCSPTTDIPGPGGGGGGPSEGGGGGGEVLGASLPATGGFSLWMLTALALLMLAAGVILRQDLTYAKGKFKKVSREFAYNLQPYALGLYLLANIKDIPPPRQWS